KVKYLIGLQITDFILQGPVGSSQVFVLIGKARTLATVFAFEPQGQTLAGIPVEAGVEHMLRRVGQRSALVDTALLFAVAIGVVAAQAPARCKLPAAGQFQTLGNG